MKKILLSTAVVLGLASPALAFWGESKPTSSDKSMAQQMEALVKEGERQTGMPAITNFTEKKMVKWLYELRDQPNYRTDTYIVTMNGQLIKICDSVGYGINASIQYSNPEKVYHERGSNGASAAFMPQAEPNGLFMPEGLAATYVMCVDSANDDVKAVYIEPEIIVSPFELDYVNQ
jgi:hypothetical protein